jgi:hypothetical protein
MIDTYLHESIYRGRDAIENLARPLVTICGAGAIGSHLTDNLARQGRLDEAGFSPELTYRGYHALDSHIVGFTLWVLPYLAIEQEQPDFAQQVMEELPLAELPHLAEHIDSHKADRPGETSEFDFGLDLLLLAPKGAQDVRRTVADEMWDRP